MYSAIWRPMIRTMSSFSLFTQFTARRSDTWQRPEDAKGGIGGALGSLQLSHLAQARHDLLQEIHICHSNVTFIYIHIEYFDEYFNEYCSHIVHVHALSCKHAIKCFYFSNLAGSTARSSTDSAPIGTMQLCDAWVGARLREIRVSLVTHLHTLGFWKSPNIDLV